MRVDFNLGDVAGVGPGWAGHGVGGLHVYLRARLFARQCEQIDGEVCPLDLVDRVFKCDVFGGGFQLFGRQGFAECNGFFGADLNGRSPGEQRTRAGAAKTVHPVGVAHQDAHFGNVDTETVNHELRQRGLNALAHRVDGGHHVDEAICANRHLDVFFQRIAAGPFEEGGDAQAAPFALGARRRRARAESVPVGQWQRLVHHMLELAGVVDLPHRVGVGHLLGVHKVAPAQFDAVNAGLARCFVHQALHDVDRLGAASAPVGPGRRGVGQHAAKVEVNGLDVVHAGLNPGADHQLDGNASAGGVGAHVGHAVEAQGENLAAGVERQLGLGVHVAPVYGGQKLLAAVGGPFDGSLGLHAAVRHGQVFRVHAGFHAEAAAHIANDGTHFFLRQAQAVADTVPLGGGHLAREADGEAAGCGVVFVEHGTRLDRQGVEALVGDVEFDDVFGHRKRGVGFCGAAVADFSRNVVVDRITQDWGVGGERIVHIHHHRQLLVVHHDGLCGVARLLQCFGHNRSHRLADEAHTLVRQGAARRVSHVFAVCALEAGRTGDGFDASGCHVGACGHHHHTRHGAGGAGINRADHRVRVR